MKRSEFEKEMKELQDKIETLKNEPIEEEDNIRWKPKDVESYWFIDEIMNVRFCPYWNGCVEDTIRLKMGNVFENKKEAERYGDFQLAKAEYMNTFTKEEWENEYLQKHCYCYNWTDKEIYTDFNYFMQNNISYFRTLEESKKFIEQWKDMILKYDFNIWD